MSFEVFLKWYEKSGLSCEATAWKVWQAAIESVRPRLELVKELLAVRDALRRVCRVALDHRGLCKRLEDAAEGREVTL